jgi:hypothetical protein
MPPALADPAQAIDGPHARPVRDNTADHNPSTPVLRLLVRVCAQNHTYRVSFQGPHAEDTALAFIARKSHDCAFHEVEDEPYDPSAFPRVFDVLNPSCDHNLSLSNCFGPGHYPPDNYFA